MYIHIYISLYTCIYIYIYTRNVIHIARRGLSMFRATYCTPDLTKGKFHWKMSLKVHWTIPVNIHWKGGNPSEHAANSEIPLENATDDPLAHATDPQLIFIHIQLFRMQYTLV